VIRSRSDRILALLAAIALVLPFTIASSPLVRVLPGRSLCWSRMLFDRDCPGCGLTRSMLSIGRFDLETAVIFNWLGIALWIVTALFLANRFTRDEARRRRFDLEIFALTVAALVTRTITFYVM
jgi:hypothetical protein